MGHACGRLEEERSAQVPRLFERLPLRGPVVKIPRSRRWRVAQLGHVVLSTAVYGGEDRFPAMFFEQAA